MLENEQRAFDHSPSLQTNLPEGWQATTFLCFDGSPADQGFLARRRQTSPDQPYRPS
jgi:hypothetical protein